MKRRLTLASLVIIGAALIVLLTGCTSIDRGTVTAKNYTPGHDSIMPITIGKSLILVPEHYPERFTLEIRNGNDTGSLNVTREDYDRTNIGDYVQAAK